jgi:hypothetical protein
LRFIGLHLLFIVAYASFAQRPSSIFSNVVQQPAHMSYVQGPIILESAELTNHLLQSQSLFQNPEYQLQLTHQVSSLTGRHYTYQVIYQGYAMLNVEIKAHINPSGQLFLIQDNSSIIRAEVSDFKAAKNSQWVQTNVGWKLAEVRILNDKYATQQIQVGEMIIASEPSKLFFHAPDSLVHASVFLVNPLNSAGKLYGAPYTDANDSDVPELLAEQKWVKMKARFVNDTFWLKSDRYLFGHVSDPKTPQTFSTNDTFYFTRSQNGFEDVNVFFHLTTYSDYLQSIGFESLLPDTLLIDAHAYGGGDESSFNYNIYPLELEFGEGGVDDAEDGEVVLHEFGHALSFAASPNTVSGKERAAMEEANCDYISTSYSLQYESFGRSAVFNWDGHNEFWNGVRTDVQKRYPTDLENSTNANRELWSSPLMCIYDKLGRGVTDTLVLEHLYYQSSGASMPQMAAIILRLDSIIYNKKHRGPLFSCFEDYNILTHSSLIEHSNLLNGVSVLNSSAFAAGLDELTVVNSTLSELSVRVYGLDGKVIYSYKTLDEFSYISPNYMVPGLYIVELMVNNQPTYVKIARN